MSIIAISNSRLQLYSWGWLTFGSTQKISYQETCQINENAKQMQKLQEMHTRKQTELDLVCGLNLKQICWKRKFIECISTAASSYQKEQCQQLVIIFSRQTKVGNKKKNEGERVASTIVISYAFYSFTFSFSGSTYNLLPCFSRLMMFQTICAISYYFIFRGKVSLLR